MKIGIGRFYPGKMGFKPHLDWDLVTGNGKNVKNQKWEWILRIAKWDLGKKMNWEMKLVQNPLIINSELIATESYERNLERSHKQIKQTFSIHVTKSINQT